MHIFWWAATALSGLYCLSSFGAHEALLRERAKTQFLFNLTGRTSQHQDGEPTQRNKNMIKCKEWGRSTARWWNHCPPPSVDTNHMSHVTCHTVWVLTMTRWKDALEQTHSVTQGSEILSKDFPQVQNLGSVPFEPMTLPSQLHIVMFSLDTSQVWSI